MIETVDPTTFIIEQGLDENNVPYKIYENTDGRKWITKGICVCCGLCDPRANVGETITFEVIRVKDGVRDTYTRTLTWNDLPGKPNACIETDYENRKDIPLTPDFKFDMQGCSLKSEWIVK